MGFIGTCSEKVGERWFINLDITESQIPLEQELCVYGVVGRGLAGEVREISFCTESSFILLPEGNGSH